MDCCGGGFDQIAWLALNAATAGWVDVAAPGVTQGVTTCVYSVAYAAYRRLPNRSVRYQGAISVTSGVGTAGGVIQIPLPVAYPMRAVGATAIVRPIGTGLIFNSSGGAYHRGLIAVQNSTTLVQMLATNTTSANYLGAVDFTEALAVSDQISWDFEYEAAS